MKVSIIFGTRPEAIKLAPVVLAFKASRAFSCEVCVTAQHRLMLDQVMEDFGIVPDADLDLMRPDQTLAGLSARALEGLDQYLTEANPDLVLVQGDTTTVFCAALAAFYRRIPLGHVEAGLRTGNLQEPWPEEANRVLTSRLTALHFAPTEAARQNLVHEGVPDSQILVTGNTAVDAILLALEKVKAAPPVIPGLPADLQAGQGGRIVLITGHRRESFGQGLENICQAVGELARLFPDVHFVYPVHLNPNVREPVERILSNAARPNMHLIEPLSYLPFVTLMSRSTLILTDSGGIQEEAPSLGKPVLVMRETTERPEAVAAGTAKLVGTDSERIVVEVSRLLAAPSACQAMSCVPNPYGDGRASERIVEGCAQFLAREASKA